jgi:hypothetical protein
MLRRRAKVAGLLCLLCVAAGCTHDVQPDYPPVPVLAIKKPTEPTAERKDPVLVMEEPNLPVPPPTALASLPPDFQKYVRFVKRSHADVEPTPTPAPIPRTSQDSKSP